jgi:hypothetical protein
MKKNDLPIKNFKSVCSKVIIVLKVEKALLEAYSDKVALDNAIMQGLNSEQYKSRINKRVDESLIDSGVIADPQSIGVILTLSNDGRLMKDYKIITEEQFEEKSRKAGIPEVITEASLVHERTHQEQHKNQYKKFLRGNYDPRIFCEFEIEAIRAGMGVLLDYLEENCSFDTKPYRDRIKKQSGGGDVV